MKALQFLALLGMLVGVVSLTEPEFSDEIDYGSWYSLEWKKCAPWNDRGSPAERTPSSRTKSS